ncbi:peptidase M61 [Candidatus Kinetoplastibacterium desouzaii TCC079E]|uniref:Peptidase M61 n=1 Tax=Candidatus Kinetoplastidibacterium desouzai TCC079E TaxID=1208919 RepID=M1L1F4_9PROT|nr:PDZ domain-containing protein [Candidatus Kinetoplastibacterium desouzaii]AGF46608.1 peptidase M61 [Candidatus Kinetoplastibacterium desouzaii TCC079E]
MNQILTDKEEIPHHEFILYKIAPFNLNGHKYKITITIQNQNNSGSIIISMPTWIPGSYLIRDFSRNIENIFAYSEGEKINLEKKDNHTWILDNKNSEISIEYIVYAYDDSVRGSYLDSNRAFFNGSSVFLYVENLEKLPCLLKVDLPQLCKEKNWEVHTSLIKKNGNSDEHLYIAESYDSLIDHPVEIGNLDHCEFTSYGTIHKLIFSGLTVKIDIKRICRDIKKICEAQINFFDPISNKSPFNDSNNLFTFFINIGSISYGGIEHRSSAVISIKWDYLPITGIDEAPTEYCDFLSLISHEYFHSWLVKRIKPASFIQYDLKKPTLTTLLWLFEGFTSYYDHLFLLRTNLIDEKTYIKTLENKINNLMQYPGRYKQSLADSSFDTWIKYYKQNENSINSIVSYYTKGSIVAFGLDTYIRIETKEQYSLDDIMRLLWKEYGENFYKHKPKGMFENDIVDIVKRLTGVNIDKFIVDYVYGTTDMPINNWLNYHGFQMECINSIHPSLGIKTNDENNTIIVTNIIEAGSAYEAGIYSGDVLIAINNIKINSNQCIESALKRCKLGEVIHITFFRHNELKCLPVSLKKLETKYKIKKIMV